MISVTRFNGTKIYLNAELIQTVESTPDTVITLTNGSKMIVKEGVQEVAERVIAYQRLVRNPQLTLGCQGFGE